MKPMTAFFLTMLFAAPLFSATRIASLSGTVQVSYSKTGRWEPAKVSMPLATADRIRTAANSRAVVLVDDSRLWVAPSSEMEIHSLNTDNFFGLLVGKMRARVKLAAGRKFHIKTPVSVASVRGTEFAVADDGAVAVIEGVVALGDLHGARAVDVGAGFIGTPDAAGGFTARTMTTEERVQLDEQWHPFDQMPDTDAPAGDAPAENQGRFDAVRDEMRAMVDEMREGFAQAQTQANETRESDISTGRTMRDMHGNVVRVEQHVLRPDPRTLEFLNLTKRAEYRYKDVLNTGWRYAGPAGSRLDVFNVTMRMNKPMPEQMTDWPSFISGQGDDLHPDMVRVLMTNQDDRIEMNGTWQLKGMLDNEGNPLEDDDLVFHMYINGWEVDDTYESTLEGTNSDGADNDSLWGWAVSPEVRVTRDGAEKKVRLYTQFAVIDNSGRILSRSHFTSASDNPFAILKQVAGEQVIFVREISGADFLRRGNLDLIVTPDAVIAIAQKLASQIGDLTGESSAK